MTLNTVAFLFSACVISLMAALALPWTLFGIASSVFMVL